MLQKSPMYAYIPATDVHGEGNTLAVIQDL